MSKNNNKIKELTPEQEAMIPIYLEKTLKEGLSTEPCDRRKVEKIVKEVYKERNLTPPKEIYWANSPREATILHRNLLLEKGEKATTLQVPEMRGQHQLSWLGFYGFLVEVMNLEWDGDLTPHLEMARNCGWWMPFEDIAICCERHSLIKRDAQNQLHSETGPAVLFPNMPYPKSYKKRGLLKDIEEGKSWEVYFWHGTAIPGEWIMNKENIDPSLALNWENIEQRRCLAEILGWNQILQQLKPVVIDKHEDPEIGELLEVDLPGSGKERFLRVKCGTGRDFVLPVPANMEYAQQANAWTYEISDWKNFKPEVRT